MSPFVSGCVVNSKHERTILFRCDATSFGAIRVFELYACADYYPALDRFSIHNGIGNGCGYHDSLFARNIHND